MGMPGSRKRSKSNWASTVSNRKYGEDGVVLRLISREKPFANAKQVDPVLEDLYLFYFREGEWEYDIAN